MKARAGKQIKTEHYRLKKMAALVADRSRVLDIGCADMPNIYLKNKEVTGFDIRRTRLTSNYHKFVPGDAMQLPEIFEPGSFDAIVCGEMLEHLERPVDFLRACFFCLEDGGILVLSTPNPNSPFERLLTLSLSRRFFFTPDHVCIFPQRWLIRMCERAGFDYVRLFSGGITLPLLGNLPFPRPWCHYTIVKACKYRHKSFGNGR